MTKAKVELTVATIEDASKEEIVKFAAAEAGIEFTGEESRSYMIQQVCDALDWVQKDPMDTATHAIIKIGKVFGQEGEYAYRGGFNGNMFSVPREKEVEVPIGFLHSILDSQNKGFTIQELAKFKEGSPSEDRVQVSGAPLSIVRLFSK